MARPQNLRTKIFLDSGDPQETKKVLEMLGFLDGQTTNPTLISKNPEIADKLKLGENLSREEALLFYYETVQEISSLIPNGSVSIEVIADKTTTSDEMVEQAREMFSWIPNAHVKLPTTIEGLRAAEELLQEDLRLNFTLCFSQGQAAAVFQVAKDIEPGQVFLSPFIGRLDDRGENGMDLIKNIIQMKKETGSKVEILTASVRKLEHLLYAILLGSDIITAPFKVLEEWRENNFMMPSPDFAYHAFGLNPILFKPIDFSRPWHEFDLLHPLTDAGIQKFADDWNAMIEG